KKAGGGSTPSLATIILKNLAAQSLESIFTKRSTHSVPAGRKHRTLRQCQEQHLRQNEPEIISAFFLGSKTLFA
ncbi:MAG: hypothetical protein ACLPTQ_25295, partial [Terriglobales bacterium]